MDNVTTLGADDKRRSESESLVQSMFGAEQSGSILIVDGRAIPDITIREEGDEICFVLDQRLAFNFPRELAHQAAAFAANAMAIGAGYPWLGADSKTQPFAPRCACIELPERTDRG